MRQKHRNDYNHGKHGWIGGNPRYGRSRGHRRGDAPQNNVGVRNGILVARKEMAEAKVKR